MKKQTPYISMVVIGVVGIFVAMVWVNEYLLWKKLLITAGFIYMYIRIYRYYKEDKDGDKIEGMVKGKQ